MTTNSNIIPINSKRKNSTEVNITVTSRDIKAGIAHPWLSPISCALVGALNIDGAEVKHDSIKLFRAGKKDIVLTTPESVQRFSFLFDMHGKAMPFNFSVHVPAQLVLREEVA